MEVVVALGVFTVIALAAAAMAIDSLGVAGDNRERVRAANLAAEEIERVRAGFRSAPGTVATSCLTARAPGEDLDAAAETVTLGIGGDRYYLRCAATWLDAASVAPPVGSPALTAATGEMLHVRVTVEWPNMGGVKPVVTDTVLS